MCYLVRFHWSQKDKRRTVKIKVESSRPGGKILRLARSDTNDKIGCGPQAKDLRNEFDAKVKLIQVEIIKKTRK